MRGVTRVLVVAVAAAVVTTALPADAHDHRPPRVVLRTGGRHERGDPWTSTWVRRDRDPRFCITIHSDGIPSYPHRGIPWRPKSKIRIRFWKDQRPRHLSIRGYRRVDSYRYAAGRPHPIDYRLRKAMSGGHRFWIAIFHGPDWKRLFLDVNVRWRDEEGCGGAESLSLIWHLRNRSA